MWETQLHLQGSAGYIYSIRALVVAICGIPKLYLQGSAGYIFYSIRALVVAIVCGITKLYLQGSAGYYCIIQYPVCREGFLFLPCNN